MLSALFVRRHVSCPRRRSMAVELRRLATSTHGVARNSACKRWAYRMGIVHVGNWFLIARMKGCWFIFFYEKILLWSVEL